MERYKPIQENENLEESQLGTTVYKELGKLIKQIEGGDISELSSREKSDIKERCKELGGLIK